MINISLFLEYNKRLKFNKRSFNKRETAVYRCYDMVLWNLSKRHTECMSKVNNCGLTKVTLEKGTLILYGELRMGLPLSSFVWAAFSFAWQARFCVPSRIGHGPTSSRFPDWISRRITTYLPFSRKSHYKDVPWIPTLYKK